MSGAIREGRLRPEFADLYPAVEPGIWLPAQQIGQQLLLWHLVRPGLPDGDRIMGEGHFEFRGGEQRIGAEAGARTRSND
jgi:hypothetical protein